MKKQIRVLSVRQPWAHLIIHGGLIGPQSPIVEHKDIENRTWTRKYRGELYIHASGQAMSANKYREWRQFIIDEYCLWIPEWCGRCKEGYPLQHGEIIGSVDLIGIEQDFFPGEDTWYMGKEHEGKQNYGWRIKWKSALEKPIPMKGMLGIWKAEIDA